MECSIFFVQKFLKAANKNKNISSNNKNFNYSLNIRPLNVIINSIVNIDYKIPFINKDATSHAFF